MADCAVEQKGEFLNTATTPNIMARACDVGRNRSIKPFVDAEGKPEARRVIFRMGVEHAEAVLPEKAK